MPIPTEYTVVAAGTLLNGELHMLARCPFKHCGEVTIVVLDRHLKPVKRKGECCHYVSTWVEPDVIRFNFSE